LRYAICDLAELSIIGMQAIEAQHARQGWIKAKRVHRKTLLDYVDGTTAYEPGEDEGVETAYRTRRAAANASRSAAAKLRRMIRRYETAQERP
jgi:hypothetical protein